MRALLVYLFSMVVAGTTAAQDVTYTFGEAELTLPTECGRGVAGNITYSGPALSSDPKAVQDIVRGLGWLRVADCGTNELLNVRLQGGGETVEVSLHPALFWQLPGMEQPHDLAEEEAEAAKARLAEIMAKPLTDDHGLAHYGWARSELLYSEEAFDLYAGIAAAEDPRVEVVMVFKEETTAPFMDTEIQRDEHGGRVVVPGPKYFAMLDRGITNAGPPIWQRNQIVRHYLKGYYTPYRNREEALARDGVVEEGFYRTNFGTYWDGTRKRVTPVSLLPLGYPNQPEDLLIDRERLEIKFGASAPGPDGTVQEPVAVLRETPADGFLAEGPSSRRVFQRRLVRDTAIEQGLSFYDDAFWTQFSSSDVQRIFESHAENRAVGDPGFSALALHFLDKHGQACGSTFAQPADWQLKEVTITTDEDGNSTRSEQIIWDMIVPARFLPILEDRFNQPDPTPGQVVGASMGLMQSGGLGQMMRDIARDREEIEASIADIEILMGLDDCGGPFFAQFEEMLFLQLQDINPVGQASLRLGPAEQTVMDIYEPGATTSLRTACIAADDFLGRRDDWRFCGCLETELEARRPDLSDFYSARFQRMFPDISAIKNDRSRRGREDLALVNVWQSCILSRKG